MSIRKITLLFVCTLVVLPAVLSSCTAKEEVKPRPNILFIFTDDHSAKAISAYGSEINETPNMDRLANEGIRFDRCYVTNAICAPSRATILTGKYNHLNGQIVNGPTFDGSQQTFPKLLREVGYQTAIVGKWHLRSAPTGFDHYEVLVGQGPYYNPPIRTATDTTVIEGYTTDIITDLALDWLQNDRDQARPFMLMYQHKAPHRPWDPGPEHLTMYDDVEIPEPETFWDDYANRASPAANQTMSIKNSLSARDLKIDPPPRHTPEQRAVWDAVYGPKNEEIRKNPLTGDDLTRWKYQRYIKDYLRAVASVDDNMGRVLDYLDESGLAENTVVIYSSDQGWYLGEHGWFDKRWMYEESLRMPLIVRWPGVVSAGSSNSDMVSNVDFASTFLDLAGAPIPDDLQGRSLRPVLMGSTPDDWRDSFYYQYYEFPGAHCVERHYGVRTDQYKLIYYYLIDEWELFDTDADPNELMNLYADPAYSDTIAELKVELTRLRDQLQVPVDDRPTGECDNNNTPWMGY